MQHLLLLGLNHATAPLSVREKVAFAGDGRDRAVALAQCGAVAVLSQPENEGRLALFGGIDDVRFKRVVKPGETLDLLCEVVSVRGPVGKGKVRASVGGEVAVRGTLTFAVAE